MPALRTLFHLTRADFLERARRYSFLVMLSLPAFYLVKNAIERDEQTRVGQIIATAPLSKSLYTLDKAFSNLRG
jgi:hypothetical protein